MANKTLNALQRSAAKFLGGGSQPMGYTQITSLAVAAGLTVAANATYALINVEAQAVRWRDDGTAPTATVGMMLSVGDIMIYTGDLAALSFIETTAGAKLNVTQYR